MTTLASQRRGVREGDEMTRSQIIELMARAFDEHYKHLGLGPCEIAYKLANEAIDAITAAGLAIVPIEPSKKMIGAADALDDPGSSIFGDPYVSCSHAAAYRAMIAEATKEQEGRD